MFFYRVRKEKERSMNEKKEIRSWGLLLRIYIKKVENRNFSDF